MTIQEDGKGYLTFLQNLHYKYIDLLSIELQNSEEDTVRESITYRYNINKAKLMYLQNNFRQFSQVVKTKNPGLIVQLEKTFKKLSTEQSISVGSTMRKSFRKS